MGIFGWIIASILATIVLPIAGIMLTKQYTLEQETKSTLVEIKQLKQQVERLQKEPSENPRK